MAHRLFDAWERISASSIESAWEIFENSPLENDSLENDDVENITHAEFMLHFANIPDPDE
jgi:hypothetical protein